MGMQLFEYVFQLFRYRQPEIRCVFYKGETFIGKIEEYNRRPKDSCLTEDMGIKDMPDSNQRKNEHLATLCEPYVYANKIKRKPE